MRLRVRSHPDFGEYADRLPYMEALPGRELIVVMEAGLFAQALAIAGQRRVQSLNRMRQVDPRNAPFIQVQPVLIGGAVVAAAVGVVALGYLLGPALAVLIEAAAAATAGVSAAAVTVADVAAHPELINSHPGQAVDIDGQAFNAILQLSTPE